MHPDRLERLLLAVAIVTLWCHEVDQLVVLTSITGSNGSGLVDTRSPKEYSYRYRT